VASSELPAHRGHQILVADHPAYRKTDHLQVLHGQPHATLRANADVMI
jgi:hypothetical protein